MSAPAEPVAISYSRAVGRSGSVALELVRAATSTLDVTFNYDEHPQIGSWRATLPEAAFTSALAKMREAQYQTLPGPSVTRPGANLVSLGERFEGDPQPHVRSFEPDTPALAATQEALEAAIRELRAHPVRVVQGEVAVADERIERGAVSTLTLTLTNVGTEPLDLSNPLGQEPSTWSGIRLAFSNGSEDERQINLTPADLEPGEGKPEITATLAPGQSLSLHTRKKIDLPKGAYDLRVEYHSMVDVAAGPQLVGGALWLPVGRVEIVRGAWWKIWE